MGISALVAPDGRSITARRSRPQSAASNKPRRFAIASPRGNRPVLMRRITLPLAVTMASEAIWQSHFSTDRSKTFFHSSSYTANPIACAAAAENLAIWREEPVLERVERLAERQATHLSALTEHPAVRNARRCGTIAALELGDATGAYLSDLGPRLLKRFREADLLLRPLGNTVYVMPPYCIGDADLARIWQAIGEAADDLA